MAAARTAGSADPPATDLTRTSGGDSALVTSTTLTDAGERNASERTGPSAVHTLSASHLASLRPPPGAISPFDRPHVAIPLTEQRSESVPLLEETKGSEKHTFEPVAPRLASGSTARRLGLRLALLMALVIVMGTLGTVRPSIPCPGHALRHLRHAHEHNAHSPAQAVALATAKSQAAKKRNVIFMISDGYGPASETMTRAFTQALKSKVADASAPEHTIPSQLPLDKFLVGQHRSMSSDSLITDSAAGATAFGSAIKSYNGAIGVVANASAPGRTSPVGTLFEAAKVQKGLLTGVVVTSRLTDATPACFVSHADDRSMEPLIAEHIVRGSLNGQSTRPGTKQTTGTKYPRTLDLAIGGGACAFLPSTHALSCRRDDVDLLAEAQSEWHVAASWLTNKAQVVHNLGEGSAHGATQYVPTPSADDSRSTSQNVTGQETTSVLEALVYNSKSGDALPFLGLLAPYNTPYEVDRLQLLSEQQGSGKEEQLKARWPSLKELGMGAIRALHADKANKNGFMLMIEGSQIDLCAHENDPACHAFEAAAYQQAVAAVAAWVEEHNNDEEETILISTSDHETGGLTLGRQLTDSYPNYAYYPERLIYAKASAVTLSRKLIAYITSSSVNTTDPVARTKLEGWIRANILGSAGAGFGPKSGGPVRDDEVASVLSCIAVPEAEAGVMVPPINTHDLCRRVIADVVSRRVEVGWSTQGHTGVDINIYAHGAPALAGLKGNMDNTDIAKFIAQVFDLDLAAITTQLQALYH